ncbi:MAG: SUMF1/EgtB/PvdO family nonheme iron enzyme [Treponema sp.]|nr:SUMF1/EgtB/PvdO family nonheme iron enzyme [Treponema sp.]
MKKALSFLFIAIILCVCVQQNVSAQQRYALVIGNGSYTTIERLANPVNDASDIAAKLRTLGYQVELHTNLGNAAMNRVISNYLQRLAQNRNNEGFFWFAGHGVEIDGENFLLPVDVDDTDDVSAKFSSYPVNRLIESFDKIARNKINIVVLDACRNNPFRNRTGSSRSLSRGLGVVNNLPPDLFIIYSTAANDVAADGTAGKRNSPFAEAFLQNMENTEDISILIRSITRETLRLTSNRQRPYHDGSIISLDYYSLNPRARQQSTGTQQTQTEQQRPVSDNMVRINGGTFTMGSPANEPGRNSDEIQRQVTVGSFFMGKYQVTQKEYQEVMGTNPSYFKGDNLPVENVSWFNAVEYCNKLSQREGLTPAYTINGTNVTWNINANGYRLPTEAEWEYACRAGTTTAYNTGATISDSTGWYVDNSNDRSHPVGHKRANAWGLFDMHGNVL